MVSISQKSKFEEKICIVRLCSQNPIQKLSWISLSHLLFFLLGQRQFYVGDGCPSNGQVFPGSIQPESNHAGVRCCSLDGSSGVTIGRCPGSSTYKEAKCQCRNLGRRLCTNDDLNRRISCGTGGACDSYGVWRYHEEQGIQKFIKFRSLHSGIGVTIQIIVNSGCYNWLLYFQILYVGEKRKRSFVVHVLLTTTPLMRQSPHVNKISGVMLYMTCFVTVQVHFAFANQTRLSNKLIQTALIVFTKKKNIGCLGIKLSKQYKFRIIDGQKNKLTKCLFYYMTDQSKIILPIVSLELQFSFVHNDYKWLYHR